MRERENDITLDQLVDYLEGRLSEDESRRVGDALEASEELMADYEWLQVAAGDFHTMGEAIVKDAPGIDVLDAVMHAVDKADVSEKIVRLEPRAKVRPSAAFWSAVVLAAAVVLIVVGLVFEFGAFAPTDPGNATIAKDPVAPDIPEGGDDGTPPERGDSQRLGEAMQLLAQGLAERPEAPTRHVKDDRFLATATPDIGKVTQDEVVSLRQAAITDPDAWGRLQRMATLDATLAGEVAENPESAPAAIVGAAGSLPDDEARQWLVTAIGRMDAQKPYAQLALAKTYASQPAPTEENPQPALFDGMTQEDLKAFLGEVENLQDSDPENGLLDALRAGALFRLGEPEAALAALESLKGKEFASAYGLEAAQARQAALTAAGMPEDAARMLSAVLAGSDQYNMLCDLARDLLQSGQAYEAQGDPDTAQAVYEATQRLGEEVSGGARLSEEALAGVDIQRMALEELQGLYSSDGLVGDIELLTTSALELVNQLNNLGGVLEYLDALFLGGGDSSFWNQLSEQILQAGDLSLFESSPS